MLTARAADRLALRARPLPRGRAGRRAWRRLVEAAGQDDPVAIEAAVRVAAACGTDGVPGLWSALPGDMTSWWRSRLAGAPWTAGSGVRVPEYVVDRAWWSRLDGDTDSDLWELLVGWGRPAGSVLRGDGRSAS